MNMFIRAPKLGVLSILAALVLGIAAVAWPVRLAASDPGTGEWPMWGGAPDRNMVSNMKGLPVQWDVKTKKNVKWVAKLGSQSYGNPVVAGGMVFVGTNNDSPRNPRDKGDRGILMCLDEKTGKFLWQLVVPKLGTGKVSDWEYLGI